MCEQRTAALLLELRKALISLIDYKLTSPESDAGFNREEAVIRTVALICSLTKNMDGELKEKEEEMLGKQAGTKRIYRTRGLEEFERLQL